METERRPIRTEIGIEHYDFPKIEQERLEVAANLVNGTIKASLPLFLGDQFMRGAEIREEIVRVLGETRKLPETRTFRDYCFHSLWPKGLALRTEASSLRKESYAATEACKTVGRAISAFSLMWEEQECQPVFRYLGASTSPGKTNAPMNRIRLLETLRQHRLNTTDLADLLNIPVEVVRKHLINLSKVGLTDYERGQAQLREKGEAFFTEYIEKLREIVKGGSLLETCRDDANVLIENPEYLKEFLQAPIERYTRASPWINGKKKEDLIPNST